MNNVSALFVGSIFLFTVGCTPPPTAELSAYRQTFVAFEAASDAVLNVVAPYERAALRASGAERSCNDEEPLHRGNLAFCYGARDAFATIGDPPLVGSYRNLIEVIARFNTIVIAYSEGVSFRFISQDLEEFSKSVDAFASSSVSEFVSAQITNSGRFLERASDLSDRPALLEFLHETYPIVDEAFLVMAVQSARLVGTIETGTSVLTGEQPALGGQLVARSLEVRSIIANWTVVLDETRQALEGMGFALTNPENLEVRIRNIGDDAFQLNLGFEAIQRQITELGAGNAL